MNSAFSRTTMLYLLYVACLALTGGAARAQELVEKPPKIVILFDVSDSMRIVDGPAQPEKDPGKNLSRQDLVRKFLLGKKGAVSFVQQLVKKAPVTAYRFGATLDEVDVSNFPDAKAWPKDKWARWLKADDLADLRAGTNIAGSALQMLRAEKNSSLQAILIFSDGRSNRGTQEEIDAFLKAHKTIPVFTIGVGDYRMPISIRIDDLQAPWEVRPDDTFAIRVPVMGTGLANEEFTIALELTRVKDLTGKPLKDEKFTLQKKGKFKGAADHPQDLIQFEIDLQKIKKILAKDDKEGSLEGEWQFSATVPRHKGEAFAKEFHVSEPVRVQVQKRALRVLLFAGGATREYQFLRTVLVREAAEKRMELSIHIQTGDADQDVAPDRLLKDFPNKLGANDKGKRYMSLTDYDVIIAFDPDWSKLTKTQLGNLAKWVGHHAGGIIFVPGRVYSHQVARPAGHEGITNSLLKIFPVVLKDARLEGLGGGFVHDSSRPYALNFTPNAKEYPFLKLDDKGESPTAGWNGFFWNDEKFTPEKGKDQKPRKGFFTYYPVDKLRPASEVIATFAGPKETRIGDKTEAFKDQQPFIVAMSYGLGKSLYLGSGELWRLRAFKDGAHEQIWIKMARYVDAGAIERQKYGRILLARNAPVGRIEFEAQIQGKDGLPLPADLRPTVRVRRIDKNGPLDPLDAKFDLKAKPNDGDWQGFFAGSIQITKPGEYEFELAIPGVEGESLRQSIRVQQSNPERDDLRTDHLQLYRLASEERLLAKRALDLLKTQMRSAPEGEKVARLFFRLSTAHVIPDCLESLPPKKLR